MITNALFLAISFMLGMTLSAVLHVLFYRSSFWQNNFLSSTIAICLATILSVTPVAYYCYNDAQFVSNIGFNGFISPLLCSLIVMAAACLGNIWTTALGLLLSCSIAVPLSDITIIFNSEWAEWLNTLCTIIVYFVFALGFYCIAGLTPMPQSQGIFASSGLAIIAALGFAPLSFGVSAAAIFGVFFIAYIREERQPVNHTGAPVLGYILGWLGLISYEEYLLPCFVIFMMYYMAEAAVAVFRKITTIEKYSDLPYNSVSYQIFEESSSPDLINRIIWHTGILLVILGVFQINAPNTFSFSVFAALVCFWQQYRLVNWNNPDKSFKENYADTVNSIKQSISSVFNHNKKKSDDK